MAPPIGPQFEARRCLLNPGRFTGQRAGLRHGRLCTSCSWPNHAGSELPDRLEPRARRQLAVSTEGDLETPPRVVGDYGRPECHAGRMTRRNAAVARPAWLPGKSEANGVCVGGIGCHCRDR